MDLPKGLISPKKAKELNQTFIKTRSNDLNKIVQKLDDNPDEKDALSTWFSIDEIKNYIAYVESKNKNVNGLRIYFGSYSGEDKKSVKKNLSTVFIVPTESKSNNLQKSGMQDTNPDDGGSDITDIDALNNGTLGNPPSNSYPQ
ncbi:hypothetical protein MHL31_10640 [Lutibacter sp. A80]|uniref:hypothetical protein n=1 Tax=Lutibacter sp. A80 TaxID=2918453 RepID=UPI001F07113C|nr:hypothetical protein [Lutibacter sp. A80]UMB59535.1 hypothetical protein MHL31_10640 [Lutibacter sp. A80]